MTTPKKNAITVPTFGTPMALRKYLEYTETDPTDLQGVSLTKVHDLGFKVGSMDDAVFIKDVNTPDGPLSHLSLLRPGMLLLGMTVTFKDMPLDVALGILSTCAQYESVVYVRKDHLYDVNDMKDIKLPRFPLHDHNESHHHYRQRSNDTSRQIDAHVLSRSSSFLRDNRQRYDVIKNNGGTSSSISSGLEVTEDFIQSGKHILSLKQWQPPDISVESTSGLTSEHDITSTTAHNGVHEVEEQYLNVDIVSPAPNYIERGEEIQFMGNFRYNLASKYSNMRSRVGGIPNWLKRRRGGGGAPSVSSNDDALSTKTF